MKKRRLLSEFLLMLCFATAADAGAQTLTLTANNVTVHQGDETPPLSYIASGATYNVAVASGEPVAKTSYKAGAAVGMYPVTLSQGTTKLNGGYTLKLVPGTITVIPVTGKGAKVNNSVVVSPNGAIQSLTVARGTCSGLVPNAPEAAAANDKNLDCFTQTGRVASGNYTRAPKMFYLPAGTYYLSAQHQFWACCWMISGDGPGRSIFKLAPKSDGFTDAKAAKQFLWFTGARPGNNGFWTYFYNIGIEIGPGNPGARAFSFIANNSDSARNVNIWFDDSLGAAGLYLNNAWPGPTMFSNIGIYGGDFGVQANGQAEYSVTFEGVTLQNQQKSGILTGGMNLVVRNLFSSQQLAGVPAWSNDTSSSVLLGGELINGAPSNPALVNGKSAAMFLVKDTTKSGYARAMVDANGSKTESGNMTLRASGMAKTLASAAPPAPTSLGLEVKETPMPSDPPSSQWAKLPYDVTKWAPALAACKSSTYYAEVIANYTQGSVDNASVANFTGLYTAAPNTKPTIPVPDCVNHIVLNGQQLSPAGTARLFWQSSGTSMTPLIIEGSSGQNTFTQTSRRPLVIKDMTIEYNCTDGAGDLFLDSVQVGGDHPTVKGPAGGIVTFCNGQHVWWRQMDNESEGKPYAVKNVALASKGDKSVLTLEVDPDPSLYPGLVVWFQGLKISTWLNNSVAKITDIAGNTLTLEWYGKHPDVPSIAETGGNYRGYYNKVACTGCTLWALNYKSEKANTDLYLQNARAEIWGGFKYNVSTNRAQPPDSTIYNIVDSDLVTNMSTFGPAQWHHWITETRKGATQYYNNPGAGGSAIQNSQFFYSIGDGKKGDADDNGPPRRRKK